MDLDVLNFLVAIADTRSIQAASKTLCAARATVRRRLQAAEAEVGAPLFRRTSRGLEPTAAGEVLVRRGREMIAEASVLLRSARSLHEEPRGPLRIAVLPGMHPGVTDGVIQLLRTRLPRLVIDLRVSDEPLKALLDAADLVVRLEDIQVPASWNVVATVPVRERLFASEAYLAAYPPIEKTADLAHHRLLVFRPGRDESPQRLPLLGGGTVPIEPFLTSNDILFLHYMAEHGRGIAWAPDANLPVAVGTDPRMHGVLEDVVGRNRIVKLLSPRALAQAAHVSPILENLRRFMPET